MTLVTVEHEKLKNALKTFEKTEVHPHLSVKDYNDYFAALETLRKFVAQDIVKFNEELHQEREHRKQLEAELMRMQGRELKLQMTLNTPEGYKLVPVKPTQEMLAAATIYSASTKAVCGKGYYGAMLAAAQPCKHERVDIDGFAAAWSFCKHCNKEWTTEMEGQR